VGSKRLVPQANSSRLVYIDWMRGLACVLMFQTHCYDSWLSPAARHSTFFMWSQLGGTFPAPLFLFLAGVSFALVTDRLYAQNLPPSRIAATTLRRGAGILGLGLLFRLQQFVTGYPWAPWTDLLRVDILNMIGVSMMGMALLCWLVASIKGNSKAALIASALLVAAGISLLTPLIWNSWRPRWLPWFLESYIDGVHNLGEPQAWLFPFFPWAAFAFSGLALGFLLRTKHLVEKTAMSFALILVAGLGMVQLGRWLDSRPQLYRVSDFWHTSPNFFLIRIGFLLMLLSLGYAWNRWGLAQRGFSPLIQLGRTSLLVYWVHIEFVYGRLSILPKRSMSIGWASLGLLTIFSGMLLLSILRVRWKTTGWPVWMRRPLRVN
jgi:uncharacterized membrane protein